MAATLRLIVGRPYLQRVAGVVLVSSAALTLADFLFKSTVAAHVAPEDLGRFLAGIYFALNALSLMVQIVLAGTLLRGSGVSRALALLPLGLLVGGMGMAFGGGLVAAVLLKTFDGGLRYSVHRTALEVLYVPISGRERGRVKGAIEVLGQRGGQALGSLAILAVMTFGLAAPILGIMLILLAGSGWSWSIGCRNTTSRCSGAPCPNPPPAGRPGVSPWTSLRSRA